MQKAILASLTLAGIALFFASASREAGAAAPPVNQDLGMRDVSFNALEEAECRVCHVSGVLERHHGLYHSVVPSLSIAPYPQYNTVDPVTGQERYNCMSCHSDTFILERDCAVCHNKASPHHQNALADAGDCVACHGDLIDNMGDGHYIPTYAPSLVTPTRSMGDGMPLNSRANGSGACNYCHNDDGLAPPTILDNHDLHHGINLYNFGARCGWCHDFGLPFDEQIRVCENCHGPDSLHNIQADSPNPGNIGVIVVGGEDAGYGHVGRDAGPGDSDCWGCHAFAMASAPGTGPIIPTVYGSDSAVIGAGADTAVMLTGTSFTNVTEGVTYVSDAELTAGDGSSVILAPDTVDLGALVLTIPGDTAPGNYDLRVVKEDFASNPTVISIVPQVAITKATGNGRVTIVGKGFGGYAAGSGTTVTGTTSAGTVEATIVSWSDTRIKAEFDERPDDVTVSSVFGSVTAEMTSVPMGGPAKRRRAR
jgi:hypothetical protein